MNPSFLILAAVAVTSTALAISEARIVHALLYLILSLLAVAMTFFLLGAPFAAALEVIVYAGAIMVTFVFVIMLLNLGRPGEEQERLSLRPSMWMGPLILAAILMGEFLYVIGTGSPPHPLGPQAPVPPKQVGAALFGQYLLAVELTAFLLLVGLIGACHLGRARGSAPDVRSSGGE